MSPGLTPAICVVKSPPQFVGVVPSRATPPTDSPTVVPVFVAVRMMGDPKKIEHDIPVVKAWHDVFTDPGPTNPRSKANPGLFWNVMKLETGNVVPPVRSTRNPVLPTAGEPRALVSVEPEPTIKDPFGPPAGGVQSTKLIPTV